jgi:hypothetical protein
MRQRAIFIKAFDLAVTSLTTALMLGATKTTTTTKTSEL